jgi:hypothetical protein
MYIMDFELIRQWLDLPPDPWPPDHYVILGVNKARMTSEEVEEQVHRRMEIVRCYQLAHPDEATEAMNRLAQAYVCLTDPINRADYDAVPAASRSLAAASAATGIKTLSATDRFVPTQGTSGPAAPPPAMVDIPVLVLESDSARTSVGQRGSRESLAVIAEHSRPAPPEETPEPAKPALEFTRVDVDAAVTPLPPPRQVRRPPSSRRSHYQRLARARKARHAWRALEQALVDPARRTSRPADVASLARALADLDHNSQWLPAGFGQASQPGHLVMALARQPMAVPTFQALLPGQREALARDWHAGLDEIEANLNGVRRQLPPRDHSPAVIASIRGIAAHLFGRPGVVLIVAGLVALQIALLRTILANLAP